MLQMRELEELSRAVRRGRGFNGWVYPAGPYVVKFGCPSLLEHERDVGVFLAREGVAVPRMHTLIDVRPSLARFLPGRGHYKGLVMGRVAGVPLDELPGLPAERALALRHQEFRRVLGLGLVPHEGLVAKNTLYVQDEDRVVLIDFEKWRFDPVGALSPAIRQRFLSDLMY